jgi:acetolactate synthase-1/2/3 large subunit
MVKLKNGADLLLAFGVRFDDRVTGASSDEFCKGGTIVHMDIDASELNKNKQGASADRGRHQGRVHAPQQDDRQARRCEQIAHAWLEQIDRVEEESAVPIQRHAGNRQQRSHEGPHERQEDQVILPQMVIEMLYEMTKGDAIITTGVGQHQMWSGQWYKYKFPRQFISSAGLGSMGYGFPSALGVKVARPDKQVIDIDGDGSFLMNIQELATANVEKIAAKAIILNNQHLGMVVQWEDNFYAGNRGHTYLGNRGSFADLSGLRPRLQFVRREVRTRHAQARPQGRAPAHAGLEDGVRSRCRHALTASTCCRSSPPAAPWRDMIWKYRDA